MCLYPAASVLLQLWGAWACLQVALFLASALFVRPRQPCFNGFAIHMPASLDSILSRDEVQAVYEHECGHRARGHVWINLVRACCFLRTGSGRRQAQELEADDYARRRGYAGALASALRKLSQDPEALWRARRIEWLGAQ